MSKKYRKNMHRMIFFYFLFFFNFWRTVLRNNIGFPGQLRTFSVHLIERSFNLAKILVVVHSVFQNCNLFVQFSISSNEIWTCDFRIRKRSIQIGARYRIIQIRPVWPQRVFQSFEFANGQSNS